MIKDEECGLIPCPSSPPGKGERPDGTSVASIKSRLPTSTATLPQSGRNTWSEAVMIKDEECGIIPCPSSPPGKEGRVDDNQNTGSTSTTKDHGFNIGTRGPLYSFDDLPEGFPIRMGPEVDLFKPFHIDSSGMIFQHSSETPCIFPPMVRGDSLGNADKGRKQQGRKGNGKQQGNQPIAPLSNWACANPIGQEDTKW